MFGSSPDSGVKSRGGGANCAASFNLQREVQVWSAGIRLFFPFP